ncbi:MAG TPA: DUF2304 domain-containing protein [Anaerolineaceae bacterium]
MIIHWSQILLISALALFILYIFRARSIFTDRLIYLACAATGIILVIDPDLATRIAHLLGVGRGTDLLFYLFIIVSLFYTAAMNSEIKRLKRQMTALVREIAITHPLEGKNTD